MNWEDFFEFQECDEVMVKGQRVWVHNVVQAYQDGVTDIKDLCECFFTIREEDVLACLLYYSLHRQQVDNYLKQLREYRAAMMEKQRVELAPLIERMKVLAEQRKREAVVR